MSPLEGAHSMPFKPGMRQSHTWFFKITLLVCVCVCVCVHPYAVNN